MNIDVDVRQILTELGWVYCPPHDIDLISSLLDGYCSRNWGKDFDGMAWTGEGNDECVRVLLRFISSIVRQQVQAKCAVDGARNDR